MPRIAGEWEDLEPMRRAAHWLLSVIGLALWLAQWWVVERAALAQGHGLILGWRDQQTNMYLVNTGLWLQFILVFLVGRWVILKAIGVLLVLWIGSQLFPYVGADALPSNILLKGYGILWGFAAMALLPFNVASLALLARDRLRLRAKTP
jgi:hypothetical protein